MPTYESPALYIDFSRLPPPTVIEEIDYEALLKIYQDEVVAKNPKLAKAVALEQSATNIILQAEAYGEMMVRARINAAARALMLPFAVGSDLDNLAAFYNLVRDQIPTATATGIVYVPESDERFRRRIQMSVEAFTTAGSEGAYIFHALSADPTIRDASALAVNDRGGVKITIMNSGSDPTPTDAQLRAVVERLNRKNIKPLTDVVSVSPPEVIEVDIVANVTLYPGPNASLVMADIQKGLSRVRDRISILGRDLNRSSVIAAINQEGVQDVDLVSPLADVPVGLDQCVLIKSATINILDARAE